MRPFIKALRIALAASLLCAAPAYAGALGALGDKLIAATSDLPRYEHLPRCDPYRKDFTCVHQDQHAPPLDPQADVWFQQALTLANGDATYMPSFSGQPTWAVLQR